MDIKCAEMLRRSFKLGDRLAAFAGKRLYEDSEIPAFSSIKWTGYKRCDKMRVKPITNLEWLRGGTNENRILFIFCRIWHPDHPAAEKDADPWHSHRDRPMQPVLQALLGEQHYCGDPSVFPDS